MLMRRITGIVVAVFFLLQGNGLMIASSAGAYCTNGVGRWAGSYYTPGVRPSIPTTWKSPLDWARGRWDFIPGSTLTYYEPKFYDMRPVPELLLALDYFAKWDWPDVPGITLGASTPNHQYASIWFNRSFNWNDDGIMNQVTRQVDVWTIALHELGHASGLAHPYASICGAGHPTSAEIASVMYVDWTTKRWPNSDDKSGIAARY